MTAAHRQLSAGGPGAPTLRTRAARTGRDRASLLVFCAVEGLALVMWPVLARRDWFDWDEWDFLAARKAGDLGDLFRPHNEHWQTVPILVYRSLYWSVGLRSYLPYQLVVVVLHLTAAALLRGVMRRAAVRPWIATAAAALFALFGAGRANIVWAFQIGFTGSLVLGLVHLLLADHDGGLDRRDWLGLLVGLIGLMTSGVAVTMTIVVGLAVLLRRGWLLAMFHTAPLGASYMAWLLVIGKKGYGSNRDPTVGGVVQFVAAALRGAYRAMGQLPGVGALLAVVLIVGLVFALRDRRGSQDLSRLAAPVALLAGSLVFLAITAFGRIYTGGPIALFARNSRYFHLVAAMTLPALAVAADTLASRWRWLFPAVIALFLVGIPGNVRALADLEHFSKVRDQATKQTMLSLAYDPLAREVPRSLRPERAFASDVTIGWLLDGVAQHRISAPNHISAADRASSRFRLSFDQQRDGAPTTSCKTVCDVTLTLKKGEVIGLYDNLVLIQPAKPGHLTVAPLQFDPVDGNSILVLRGTGRTHLSARNGSVLPRLCTGP